LDVGARRAGEQDGAGAGPARIHPDQGQLQPAYQAGAFPHGQAVVHTWIDRLELQRGEDRPAGMRDQGATRQIGLESIEVARR
jgi:hypothetical protein